MRMQANNNSDPPPLIDLLPQPVLVPPYQAKPPYNRNDPWTIEQSAQLYGIEHWGRGYFSINPNGHIQVLPTRDPLHGIDLKKLVDELGCRGLQPPLLIRFADILKTQITQLHQSFSTAIHDNGYQGNYCCVYPLKVNQQRPVMEEILRFSKPFGFGVEAGSKPELLAVMAMVQDDDTPILCNGFKDDQFIEAVILATKIGKNIIPIVEKFSELQLIARYAKMHHVKPSIGIRVKLAAPGSGRWEHSGGVRSKFGLFISEVLDATEFLRQNDMLGCLNLLHFHLGSQINNIRNIKNAIIELARVYVELQRAGADLKCIDVGGGMGVDYNGSQTDCEFSINYSLQEYANDVVFHIKEICDQAGVQHPTIISESGRSMVAYHSVLITNVMGQSGFDRFELPNLLNDAQRQALPAPVVNLFDAYHDLDGNNYTEYYHDALLARDEMLHLFSFGYCSLQDRGLGERLFFGLCYKVLRIVRQLDFVPDQFQDLEAFLSDIYFCNYSIFQSMPDSWAIGQLFPIMPIHRLNEPPTCRGILADITCDSDGKVDRFIDRRGTKNVLELHPYTGQPYYLAAFLVGAYQETLGDMHNLLGDTHAVHVSLDDHGHVIIDEVIQGDTTQDVLGYVQFSVPDLVRSMRQRVASALGQYKITPDESRVLLEFYEKGLQGYTYLE